MIDNQKYIPAILFVLNIRIFCASTEGECRKDGSVECCSNFMEKDGKCVPCPAGRFGTNCSEKCPKGYYGIQCKYECSCAHRSCHSVTGCSPYGICDTNGTVTVCCINFFKKSGKCVPCPAGSVGTDCSFRCPIGYYGFMCLEKCNCTNEQSCHVEKGCLHYGKLSSDGTDARNMMGSNYMLAIGAAITICIVSLAVIMIIVKRKKYHICTFLLTGICSSDDPVPPSTEDDEIMQEDNGQGSSQIHVDAVANQASRDHCSLASVNEIYDDTNKVSDVYAVLKLRPK